MYILCTKSTNLLTPRPQILLVEAETVIYDLGQLLAVLDSCRKVGRLVVLSFLATPPYNRGSRLSHDDGGSFLGLRRLRHDDQLVNVLVRELFQLGRVVVVRVVRVRPANVCGILGIFGLTVVLPTVTLQQMFFCRNVSFRLTKRSSIVNRPR